MAFQAQNVLCQHAVTVPLHISQEERVAAAIEAKALRLAGAQRALRRSVAAQVGGYMPPPPLLPRWSGWLSPATPLLLPGGEPPNPAQLQVEALQQQQRAPQQAAMVAVQAGQWQQQQQQQQRQVAVAPPQLQPSVVPPATGSAMAVTSQPPQLALLLQHQQMAHSHQHAQQQRQQLASLTQQPVAHPGASLSQGMPLTRHSDMALLASAEAAAGAPQLPLRMPMTAAAAVLQQQQGHSAQLLAEATDAELFAHLAKLRSQHEQFCQLKDVLAQERGVWVGAGATLSGASTQAPGQQQQQQPN